MIHSLPILTSLCGLLSLIVGKNEEPVFQGHTRDIWRVHRHYLLYRTARRVDFQKEMFPMTGKYYFWIRYIGILKKKKEKLDLVLVKQVPRKRESRLQFCQKTSFFCNRSKKSISCRLSYLNGTYDKYPPTKIDAFAFLIPYRKNATLVLNSIFGGLII